MPLLFLEEEEEEEREKEMRLYWSAGTRAGCGTCVDGEPLRASSSYWMTSAPLRAKRVLVLTTGPRAPAGPSGARSSKPGSSG